MANKKNFDGLSTGLAEQAKNRFGGNANNEEQESINKKPIKKDELRQKTFYLSSENWELLRRAAYEENRQQTEIVTEALEEYFIRKGYKE